MSHAEDDARCGRPTTAGHPCRFRRWQMRWYDPLGWTPAACGYHMTPDEWEELYEIEDAYSERKRAADERRSAQIRSQPVDTTLFRRNCRSPECEGSPIPWFVTIAIPDPVSCREHLTAEELLAYDEAYQEVMARLERLAREPECWSWPEPPARSYLTEDEASDALADWQRFRGCAICGDRDRLVEDHDHKTGLVRGKLCHACNVREGMGSDRPPFVKYRERNPASIMGVKVRYWSSWTGYAEPEPVLTEAEQREEEQRLRDVVDRLRFPSVDEVRGFAESLLDEPLPHAGEGE